MIKIKLLSVCAFTILMSQNLIADDTTDDTSVISQMSGGSSFKVTISDTTHNCALQYDAGIKNQERNAKFDCTSQGDEMTFHATGDPRKNADNTYSIDGIIMTLGDTCGLEWDANLNNNERNAKFDCSGSADPLTLTSLKGGGYNDMRIDTIGCGLQWDAGLVDNERNAKFDCSPGYDGMRLSGKSLPLPITTQKFIEAHERFKNAIMEYKKVLDTGKPLSEEQKNQFINDIFKLCPNPSNPGCHLEFQHLLNN